MTGFGPNNEKGIRVAPGGHFPGVPYHDENGELIQISFTYGYEHSPYPIYVYSGIEIISDFNYDRKSGLFWLPCKKDRWVIYFQRGVANLFDQIDR